RHEPEITVIRHHPDAEKGENPVIQVRGSSLEPRVFTSVCPDPEHQVITLPVFYDHLLDLLGGILQIGVNRDYRISARVMQTCRQRALKAEVVPQRYNDYVII